MFTTAVNTLAGLPMTERAEGVCNCEYDARDRESRRGGRQVGWEDGKADVEGEGASRSCLISPT